MNRRKFIKGAAVAGGATAVAASTFPAPAIAQNRIEIAMVTTWPRDFPGLGTCLFYTSPSPRDRG